VEGAAALKRVAASARSGTKTTKPTKTTKHCWAKGSFAYSVFVNFVISVAFVAERTSSVPERARG
jgi:hypothetical protein